MFILIRIVINFNKNALISPFQEFWLSFNQLITNTIWNLTNEIHLTLTEWKPIPYIFPKPVQKYVSAEDRILAN